MKARTLAVVFATLAACASTPSATKGTHAMTTTPNARPGLKIKMTNVYVDDQEKALRFYTEVLGLVKKTDVSKGPYRWLTVAAADEPQGTELQLAKNDNPAAKAFQQAMFEQRQPALMLFSDDVQAD